MPIMRTYMCPECSHRIEVTLAADQWDAPPPSCDACDARMGQEFMPPAIGGSIRSRAVRLTEDIMANDYHVADAKFDNREGGKPKVRYKDETPGAIASAWTQAAQTHHALLEQGIAIGKQTRRETGGDGLDILKRTLATGEQPDLIEASKRRAIKVW